MKTDFYVESQLQPFADRLALSVNETASALGLSRPSVYAMMATGQLRYVRVGKTRRVPMTELERLLSQ